MIYLDYQATTPLAPEALDAMLPWLSGPGTRGFANPHSPHAPGRAAAAAVEHAREQVAALMPPGGRLVFTSGATEAAHIGLIGATRAAPSARRKLVTLATEHACVLDTLDALGREGWEVVRLPVRPDGLVDLASAAAAIDDRTALVAAMLVNNEIGVIQPVGALADLAHAVGALFFSDVVQGFGRVPLPGEPDLLIASAHKIHGPKGVGALWVRDGVELAPVAHGGGQEGGLRSGTLSPALCAGFGSAAALMRPDAERAHAERLWSIAANALVLPVTPAKAGVPVASRAMASPVWTLNGSPDHRWPGNLNIRHPDADAARLISEVRRVAFSAGSACASGSGRPSHVLAALGLSASEAHGSLRLGWGRYTTEDDLAEGLALIRAATQGAFSPRAAA